jgi:hypothetical protein
MEGFSAASNRLCPREAAAAHLDDGLAVQPVATHDVAMRLLRCVADGPGGLLKDFRGPEILSLREAPTQWKTARGMRRPTVRIPIPGTAYAAFRHGFSTNQDGELGTVRWNRWLAKSPFEPNEPES